MSEQPATPPQIAVNIQYVRDFSLENPNAPSIFAPSETAPEVSVGVNIQTRPVAENTHEVILMLKLETKIGDRVAFIAELAYGGIFTVTGAANEDQLKFILMAEAPRYLFPFARSFVAGAVRDAGFPQVLLNPIDFVALFQANANQPTEGAEPQEKSAS